MHTSSMQYFSVQLIINTCTIGRALSVMFTPLAYFSISLSPSFCTVTSFPDGHFNMGALDRLEKVAGIPIFEMLAPKLLEMASTLDFHDSIVGNIRNENSPVDGTKAMFKAWLSDESSLPPSWQVHAAGDTSSYQDGRASSRNRVLLQENINHLAIRVPSKVYARVGICMNCTGTEFEFLFQISEWKKEVLELDVSEIESEEQWTKPDCREVAVQNSPDCQEVAVQTQAAECTGIYKNLLTHVAFGSRGDIYERYPAPSLNCFQITILPEP